MAFELIPGFGEFFRRFPRMSVSPIKGESITIRGEYNFSARAVKFPEIIDSYRLEIHIPHDFPKTLPSVYEVDSKIPRNPEHHVNGDGTLCMGSPLRLRWKLAGKPTLIGFAEECLTPYLYGVSYKLEYGKFPFGELDHGKPGVIADYINLFGLKTGQQVEETIKLISMKKRIANKQPCPCGCNKRLGSCSFHFKVNSFRKIAPRTWFGRHLQTMGTEK